MQRGAEKKNPMQSTAHSAWDLSQTFLEAIFTCIFPTLESYPRFRAIQGSQSCRSTTVPAKEHQAWLDQYKDRAETGAS